MTAKTGAQHLHEMHSTAAAHHEAMAKTKKSQAGHFREMLKQAAMGADAQSPHAKLTAELDQETTLHEAHAAYHRDAAAKCEKAEADSLAKANRIEPTQVMAINPAPHQRVTAVPRTGAPPLGSAVDLHISKILGLSPSDQDSDEKSLQ